MKKLLNFNAPYKAPETKFFEFSPVQLIAASYDSGNNPEGVNIDDDEFTW